MYVDKCVLFVNSMKIPENIANELLADSIEIRPYEDFCRQSFGDGKVWIDPETASVAVYDAVAAEKHEFATPIGLLKSCKNACEVAGARACHIRDGVA